LKNAYFFDEIMIKPSKWAGEIHTLAWLDTSPHIRLQTFGTFWISPQNKSHDFYQYPEHLISWKSIVIKIWKEISHIPLNTCICYIPLLGLQRKCGALLIIAKNIPRQPIYISMFPLYPKRTKHLTILQLKTVNDKWAIHTC
jgi:hypothetical protein